MIIFRPQHSQLYLQSSGQQSQLESSSYSAVQQLLDNQLCSNLDLFMGKIIQLCNISLFQNIPTLMSLINVGPTITDFEKFHPPQNKNPPSTFIDFLDFSTLHSSFIRFMYQFFPKNPTLHVYQGRQITKSNSKWNLMGPKLSKIEAQSLLIRMGDLFF